MCSYISKENIEKLFESANVPKDPYLLVIDVDGIDYHLWDSLQSYRPAFVFIEYNASFPANSNFVVDYNPLFQWQKDDYFGAAIKPLVELGKSKGYEIIHVTSNGDNLVFVEKSIFNTFNFPLFSVEDFYQLPQYGKHGRALNGKGHPVSKKNSTRFKRFMAYLQYHFFSICRSYIRHKITVHYVVNKKNIEKLNLNID